MYSLAALNVLLSITASLGNILILVALRKESSLHPPSKLLFRCLTLADLFVGVLSQPLFAVSLIFIAHKQLQLCYTAWSREDISGRILSRVSLCTVTQISLDRLLALLLGLTDKTSRRMRGAVIFIWILNIALCSLRLLSPIIISWVSNALIYILLVTSAFCYMKFYLNLRHHQVEMLEMDQVQPNGEGTPRNHARYRKSVTTAQWVQLTLVACYLPFSIVIQLYHTHTLHPIILLSKSHQLLSY